VVICFELNLPQTDMVLQRLLHLREFSDEKEAQAYLARLFKKVQNHH
jgi:hypothetical protein